MKSWIRTLHTPDSGTSRSGTRHHKKTNERTASPHVWDLGADDASIQTSLYHQKHLFGGPGPTADLAQDTSSLIVHTPPRDLASSSATSLNNSVSERPRTALESTDSGRGGCQFFDMNQHVEVTSMVISSEHFLRLAYESYEQLKVAHYKASLEFSLSEWLHVHALLFYGRIQKIRRELQMNKTDLYNQIDIDDDVLVFGPIAKALEAIGAVEDEDCGLMYVPDAIFPRRSVDTIGNMMSMGPEERSRGLQNILKGTLYDWERSWRRLTEARVERETRFTKSCMTRSPSELINLIERTFDSIAKIRERSLTQLTEESSSQSADEECEVTEDQPAELSAREPELISKEEQLAQLFEEARNSRDYTIRLPGERSYHASAAAIHPIFQTSAQTPSGKLEQQEALGEKRGAGSPDLFSPLKRSSTQNGSPTSRRSENKDLFEKLTDNTAQLSLNLLSLDTVDIGGLDQDFRSPSTDAADESFDESLTSPCVEEDDTDSDRTVESIPPKAPRSRISSVPPFFPIPSLEPESRAHSPQVKQKVRLGGSRVLEKIVQYDEQLWTDYNKFISAIIERGLAKFHPLKWKAKGTHAWMIAVKEVKPVSSDHHVLRMPRKSIPVSDQELALILRSVRFDSEPPKHWHVEKTAKVNMKHFLGNFIGDYITST